MDPELAQQMFEEGGTLVLLGMPTGTEFGIDMNSWNVAERFRGVKMIPPGLHFVYFSAVSRQGETAPRTGFFHMFQQREILVRHYDPSTEDLKQEEADGDEVERIRLNLQEMDRYLGAYPIESWNKWVSLTQHIKEGDFQRMVPLSGKICSVSELICEDFRQANTRDRTNRMKKETSHSELSGSSDGDKEEITSYEDSSADVGSPKKAKISPFLPDVIPKPGTELRFSKFPSKPYGEGATPSEITRYSLDSSYSVKQIIANMERPESILAELQFSFICFLVGQVWEGWEQWRRLVTAICRAEEFLLEKPELYHTILSILHFQIQEVPEDLFVDIVENNNFLAAALTALFANVDDNSSALPATIVSKARRFKKYLTAKFKWDLNLADEGEDAPVIVET